MTETETLVCRDVRIPMRDGVVLSSDLYLGPEPAMRRPQARPVILVRTPYDRTFVAPRFDIRPFVDRGYAVMFQDVRGTGASGGFMDPLMNESSDGADTIAWLIAQPWCNGQVGMTGPSYMGGVQLQLAVRPVTGLRTAFIQVPAANVFGKGMIYDDDVLALETAAPWVLMMAASTLGRFPAEVAAAIRSDMAGQDVPLTALLNGDALHTFLLGHSLRELPIARHVPFWHDWLDNRDNPRFFAPAETDSRLGEVSRPLMHFAGWYDLFLRNTLAAYVGATHRGATPEARSGQRLMIGPWSHVANPAFRQFPDSDVNDAAACAAWMDQHLRGEAHCLFSHPVILYVMGENRWRAEPEWPCRGTVPTRFFLHSKGRANGVAGDGTLSTDAPEPFEPADQYRSDPASPIRSLGGHGVTGGPVDQRPNGHRRDILVYSTEPLRDDVEVTGYVSATVHAASSATDTDWFVKLIDVFPDGRSYNIVSGAARARYRHSRTAPAPLTPGEVVAYQVDLHATSNVFKKGHRIRVEISSSDFPNADLNPNRFMDLSIATAADHVVAEQTVFHDASRPSAIDLPIIPMDRDRQWIETPFPVGPGEQAYTKYDSATSKRPLREIALPELQT
ncbi:MAG: CocE/NonD family hydrolase [Gammaproteobacteria bacterium]